MRRIQLGTGVSYFQKLGDRGFPNNLILNRQGAVSIPRSLT